MPAGLLASLENDLWLTRSLGLRMNLAFEFCPHRSDQMNHCSWSLLWHFLQSLSLTSGLVCLWAVFPARKVSTILLVSPMSVPAQALGEWLVNKWINDMWYPRTTHSLRTRAGRFCLVYLQYFHAEQSLLGISTPPDAQCLQVKPWLLPLQCSSSLHLPFCI